MARSTWDDRRDTKLKKLWAEGIAAKEIATTMGGFGHCKDGGKSTIIGRANRLKCTPRTTERKRDTSQESKPRQQQRKRRRSTGVRPKKVEKVNAVQKLFAVEPFVPTAEELDIPLNERKSLETLDVGQCRWPIGDPHAKDFHFCGRKNVTDLSYCEFHARRAFQPPIPRKRQVPMRVVR